MYKRIFTILILLLLFLLPKRSEAIDTNSIKYFPLHVGNVYVYDRVVSGMGYYNQTIKTAEIIAVQSSFGKVYYHSIEFPRCSNDWLRTDSITGSLYTLDSAGSCPNYYYFKSIDSISANVGDTITSCGVNPSGAICSSIQQVNLFGHSYEQISFGYSYYGGTVYIQKGWSYCKNIGPTGYQVSVVGGGGFSLETYTLKGCVINGVVYGDTTMTNIKSISNQKPSDYKLFQNYPNPFNPSTNIKFDIHKSSHVTLIIYNILGKELTTLVNEKVNAGSYEVSWDAIGFPSGVYFYKLIADDFIDTKRMLLVK